MAFPQANTPLVAPRSNIVPRPHTFEQSVLACNEHGPFGGEVQHGKEGRQLEITDYLEDQEYPVSTSKIVASSSKGLGPKTSNDVLKTDAGVAAITASRTSKQPTSTAKISKESPKVTSLPKKRKTVVSKRDVETWKYKYGLCEDLPPLDNIRDIVHDMVKRLFDPFRLLQARLDGHTLQVATLCSGTESPILFLTELVAALAEEDIALQFKHVFSAEIEPFKQAYIESNFHPPLLFRDITQFGVDDRPETAYGTRADLPSDIDLLIAGFSCVDFSNLNSHKKTLDDDGQSGTTARAVLRYAQGAKVPIVILENIASAPWVRLKQLWKEGGYETLHIKVDTKDYYIPHTRQRGYMICILTSSSVTPQDALGILDDWKTHMTNLKRPASSPFQNFLLEPDDPRLRRALAEFHVRNTNRINMPWVRYEARHLSYRDLNKYGPGKPVTEWKPNGTSTMVEHGQRLWLRNEVDRVKDTLDISVLRCAQRGYDMHSKCVVTDFSQGIDRQTDTTPAGLVPCITPSGLPYSTIRGGLITGIEALRLQGIPTEELSLTRESQRELHNMAGNAMSTTVVGAAIASSLIAAMKILPRSSGIKGPTPPALSDNESYHGLDHKDGLQLIKKTISTGIIESTSAKSLMSLAAMTVAQCMCEGSTKFANQDFLACKGCNYIACKNCRGKPFHDFEDSRLLTRLNPSDFKAIVKRALPMCISLTGFEDLGPLKEGPPLDTYLHTVQQSMRKELRFSEVKRSTVWTILYKSPAARLEFRVSPLRCEWLYFTSPDKKWPCNSKDRKFLEHPVGHMNVKGENLLKGQWKFRWPDVRILNIVMTQKGYVKRVPAWRAKLKLPEFAADRVPMEIFVSTNGDLPKIDGKYTYLPDCGTACASLYVQASAAERPMYFFLDPDPFGDPKEDRFVFSPNPRRLVPGQTRYVVASVGQSVVTQWLLSSGEEQTFAGTIDQRWLETNLTLTPVERNISITTPGQDFKPLQDIQMIDSQHCADKFTPVLTCAIQKVEPKRGAWILGPWVEVTDNWLCDVFTSTAWVTSRCADLGGVFDERRYLNLEDLHTECETCAPKPAQLKWKREGAVYQPYEDPSDAAAYEAATKTRPNGIVAFTKSDTQGQGYLLLGIHVITLAHQALASLLSACWSESGASPIREVHQDQLEVSWALNTRYSTDIDMPRTHFVLKNNQDDPEMKHVFKHAIEEKFNLDAEDVWPPELRPEQARSLHWMVNQESPNAEPFIEEETEEMYLSHLGWLLDTTATLKRQVCGGVVADGVGYGKTITTLALTESQKAPNPVIAFDGRIPLKATLILVTAGTLPQWESEATNFLGKNSTILVFKDLAALKKSDIADFKTADIIIAPHALITGLTYLDRYSRFAAVPAAPAASRSRAFATWARFANARTVQHIAELKAPDFPKLFGNELCRRRQDAELDKDLHERVPCKGRASVQPAGGRSKEKAGGGKKLSMKRKVDENEELRSLEKTSDPFSLNTAMSLDKISGPLFEMFEFHRIVIDEFTYLTSKDCISINALRSLRKWILSGTPPLEDFADIKRMANALGIHLGRDDPDKNTMAARNVREMQKEQTGFEKFRWYANPHTRKWVERRSWIAQRFLSRFVRKNIPTVRVPESIMMLNIVNLTLLERATYTELEACLIEKDMQTEKIKRTKYMDDRETRIHNALQAKSGELGLLGAAMYLMPDTSNTFVGTRDDFDLVLSLRKVHLSNLQKAMTSILSLTEQVYNDCKVGLHQDCKAGLHQHCQVDEYCKVGVATHYENWIKSLQNDKFDDMEAGKNILKMRPTVFDPPIDRDTLVAEATKYLKHIVNSETEDLASRFSPEGTVDHAKPKRQKTMEKLADPKLDQRVVVLRELTTYLSMLTSQYVKALRAIRYLNAIGFLHAIGDKTIEVDCGHYVLCRTGQILTSCGHTVCPSCVNAKSKDLVREAIEASAHSNTASKSTNATVDVTDKAVTDVSDDEVPLCVVTGCNAHMTDKRPVRELLVDESIQNEVKNFQGSKIIDIVRLIKNVIPKDDQVIVFVQDDRIMKTISKALIEVDVSNHPITESIARSAKAGEWIRRFRKGNGEETVRVLLLNSANETCAGSNLQNAHHVIFVAPLHATSDYDYTSSETQCLGRASRKGQKEAVKLYRFLTVNTIDVDLLEARTAKKVVRVDDVESKDHGTWMLKEKKSLTEGELVQDWGTVIGRDFLPSRLNEEGGDTE